MCKGRFEILFPGLCTTGVGGGIVVSFVHINNGGVQAHGKVAAYCPTLSPGITINKTLS